MNSFRSSRREKAPFCRTLLRQIEMEFANERGPKRQRTAALQNADATQHAPLVPRGFGVRLSSAAFGVEARLHSAPVHWPHAAPSRVGFSSSHFVCNSGRRTLKPWLRLEILAPILALLIAGCATNNPNNQSVFERHFPPNAFMTHRAVFTARGRQFALTGYLALSETGGMRLIISQSLGQTMADLLVKPDGTVHVMQASPMFKPEWIRKYVASDLECLFGRSPPKKCAVQMFDSNHFL